MTAEYSVVRKGKRGTFVMGGTKKFVISWLNERSDSTDDLSNFEVGTHPHAYKRTEWVDALEFLKKEQFQDYLKDTFVSKYYRMDPKTDDLLINGHKLKNGMIVLIESPDLRQATDDIDEGWKLHKALGSNRWCTVSEIGYRADVNMVVFIGIYEGGTKQKHTVNSSHSWYVKKFSVDLIETRQKEKYDKVLEEVMWAMSLTGQVVSSEGSEKEKEQKLGKRAEKTTQAILRLF